VILIGRIKPMKKYYHLLFLIFLVSTVEAQQEIDNSLLSTTSVEFPSLSSLEPTESLVSPQEVEAEILEQEPDIVSPEQTETNINAALESIEEEEVAEKELSPEKIEMHAEHIPSLPDPEQPTKRERRIRFNFVNEDLTKIINLVASKLHRNVILPQGALAIVQKVTFKHPQKISLKEAEKYLALFLDLAGYSMHPQGNYYVIVKNEQITREPLPLYINISPEELPRSDERIRTVYYLANLKVPEAQQGPLQADPLIILLRESLSPTASFVFDTKSNGLIITDKASNIAAVMKIILELDSFGSKEVIEILPLYNSSARLIAEMLNKQILAIDANRTMIRTDIRSDGGNYFSSNVRIVSYDEANKLIIIGRETAVNRIIEFVREYMDAPQPSGKSILHAVDLQYLDADEFAKVLQKVVAPRGTGTGQAQKDISGPTIFFEGVRIVPETHKAAEAAKTIEGGAEVLSEGSIIRGGNRLIIAARERDWKYIKSLIEDLDKPQRQVIIEVMIADITLMNQNLLGGQVRNPSFIKLPNGINFQAAHLAGPITNETSTEPPTTIASDLLRILIGSETSIANFLTSPGTGFPGSLIISFNDTNGSGIWGLLQILQEQTTVKVLSHPYLVTLNNFRAQEVVSEIRRVRGDQSVGEGGISSARQEDVEAALKVAITPRISSIDRLNLQITINIEQFTSTDQANANRATRMLQTNTNLTTGQVLVLGGLTQLQEKENETETPILGRIPLIGWFFRNTLKTVTKSNLAVFISPTIVEPKLREGQKRYTNDKVKDAYQTMETGLIFDNLRDPITRWFFTPQTDADIQLTDEYLREIQGNGSQDQQEIDEKQLLLTAAKPLTTDEEDSQRLKALLTQETQQNLQVPTTQPVEEVVAYATGSNITTAAA
jgi:general secretion pathway protein D